MRLACLNHAASVQAEPGSNSSIKFLGTASASCFAEMQAKARTTKSDSFASCVCPRNRVHPTNQIVLPICCKAQTPSLALKLQGMIRRSSIACTTKMLEFVCATLSQYTHHSQTHILAAIRLFDCQRTIRIVGQECPTHCFAASDLAILAQKH